MSEWTPGPWRKENPDWMTPHIWIAADNDDGGIAKIECCDRDDGLGERLTGTDYANARLIAAAPDLYEALERVLSAHKARCEWPTDDTTKRFDAMLKEVEWAEEAALAALAKARGEAQ